MASGLADNATGNEPLLYACQNWCYHFSAVVSSGRAGALSKPKSSFGQEMKHFLKKLVHEWLKSWMYNVQSRRNMGVVHEAVESSCIRLKVCVFSNFFISFFEIFKLFREFLAQQRRFIKGWIPLRKLSMYVSQRIHIPNACC
jgi:hypothetical protein